MEVRRHDITFCSYWRREKEMPIMVVVDREHRLSQPDPGVCEMGCSQSQFFPRSSCYWYFFCCFRLLLGLSFRYTQSSHKKSREWNIKRNFGRRRSSWWSMSSNPQTDDDRRQNHSWFRIPFSLSSLIFIRMFLWGNIAVSRTDSSSQDMIIMTAMIPKMIGKRRRCLLMILSDEEREKNTHFRGSERSKKKAITLNEVETLVLVSIDFQRWWTDWSVSNTRAEESRSCSFPECFHFHFRILSLYPLDTYFMPPYVLNGTGITHKEYGPHGLHRVVTSPPTSPHNLRVTGGFSI